MLFLIPMTITDMINGCQSEGTAKACIYNSIIKIGIFVVKEIYEIRAIFSLEKIRPRLGVNVAKDVDVEAKIQSLMCKSGVRGHTRYRSISGQESDNIRLR